VDLYEIIQNNADELAKLRQFCARLSDADLRRPMDAGWTPAAALAHVAFWDLRASMLIRRWQKDGIGPSPRDVDAINDAMLPICLALQPREAVRLALESAGEVDRLISGLDPAFAGQIEADGKSVRLGRGEHRRYHRVEIEQLLEIK
jgi:hypothetical protein